jgi:ABC-type nitrate/sulfonate/bicarbonate transport system substrate-binding protein
MTDGELYHSELDQREVPDKLHCGIWNLLRWLVFFAFFTLSITACQERSEKSAGPPEKITIAYPTSILSILIGIAFEKGFFSAEGLEVTPQPHEYGKVALQSVLEGTADLAVVADTPVMFAITGGKKIYTIAVITKSNKGEAVVVRKDRGISSPLDLKGKNIGVTMGTAGDFFLDSFLSTRGISRGEAKIIDMKPGEMLDALVTGKVDAVSTWQPLLISLQRKLGEDGITFYDEIIYTEIGLIAARQEYVEKHPEAVKKVLRALIGAETFVKENPDESRRLVAEFIKVDKALLDEIWNSFDFRVTLEQSLFVSLEDQTRWAQQEGLTGGTDLPNYLDFIYFDGLQSVKPEAVRIIR